MKKIIFLAVAVFMFNFANAQTSVVKTNPVAMAFGFFNGSYEFMVTESNSLELTAGFVSRSILGTSITGFSLSADYRFYFMESKTAPEGLFAAPIAGFGMVSADDFSATTISAGAIGGYQFIFGEETGFALDLFVGALYNAVSVGSGDLSGYGGSGVSGTFGVQVGYAF